MKVSIRLWTKGFEEGSFVAGLYSLVYPEQIPIPVVLLQVKTYFPHKTSQTYLLLFLEV